MIRSRALGALQHKRDEEARAEQERLEQEARQRRGQLLLCRAKAAKRLLGFLRDELAYELPENLVQYDDGTRKVDGSQISVAHTTLEGIVFAASDNFTGIFVAFASSYAEIEDIGADVVNTAAQLGELIEKHEQGKQEEAA